jgi:hypothetical protein
MSNKRRLLVLSLAVIGLGSPSLMASAHAVVPARMLGCGQHCIDQGWCEGIDWQQVCEAACPGSTYEGDCTSDGGCGAAFTCGL